MIGDQEGLPRPAKIIVWTTIAAGLVAVGITALMDRSARMSGTAWVVAGVIAAMQFHGWARPMVLYRGDHSQGFQLDELYFVVLALVVPPVVTLGVFAVAVTAGQIVRRRPLVKSAFNLGEVMLAASVALAVSRAIAVPSQPLTMRESLAAGLGAAVYFLLSTGVVSALMVSTGIPWRECVSADFAIQAAVSLTGVAVGILVAPELKLDSWATALAISLLVALPLLLAAQFKLQQDRARMRGLFDVTLDANRCLRHEAALDTILGLAREQLRCGGAALSDLPPGLGELGSLAQIAGLRHWLIVSGRRREEPFEPADQILLDAIAAIAQGALTNAEPYPQVHSERS